MARVRRRRGPHQLRNEPHRRASAARCLRRWHPEGDKAGGLAGHSADQIRVGDQSQDGKDPRSDRAADAAGPRRRGGRVKRREFITLLGGAATAWPLAARAQQPAKLPTVGFIGSDTPDAYAVLLRAFRVGLKATGFIEGQNVAIEYRWAEGRNEKLSEF